jgi:hypothetical protein
MASSFVPAPPPIEIGAKQYEVRLRGLISQSA